MSHQPSKIIGIYFSMLSPDEIRNNSVVEVVSRETYTNNKPVIGGLFDPKMGVLEKGSTCPTDGLTYIHTPGYFGHIELARPVLFIQHIKEILKILKCVCFTCSKILLDKNQYDYLLDYDPEKRWNDVYKLIEKTTEKNAVNLPVMVVDVNNLVNIFKKKWLLFMLNGKALVKKIKK